MIRKVSMMSLVILAAACAPAEDGEMDTDMTPPSVTDPTPPSTPPETPPTSATNAAPVITTESISGQEGVALETTLRATDDDGDAISFALVEGPEWLQISTSGAVTGTPGGSDIGDGSITVSASDGEAITETDVDLEIAYDPIEQALRTGDYTIITNETELTPPEAMLADFEQTREQNNADIAEMFELGSNGQALSGSHTNLTWQYGNRARFYTPSFGGSAPLILSTHDSNGNALNTSRAIALFGRHENGRFAMLGENPFRLAALDETSMNEDMQSILENLTQWLLDADPEDGFDVVLAHLAEANSFPDESATRDWLTATFGDAVSYNSAGSCDGTNLDSCLSDETALIILSQEVSSMDDADEITDRIEQALHEGIPVLYLHSRTNINQIASNLLDMFGVEDAGRNTANQTTSEFSPVDTLENWQPAQIAAVETLVERIETNDLEYDLSACRQYWRCPENETFATEVTAHLSELRNQLTPLNNQPGGAFPTAKGFRWKGFSVLTGDFYRSQTIYPMSNTNTPSRDIVRAFFGDLTALIARDINPAANLGTFGRSEFPEYLRTDKTVELTTQRPFRTTGVYAFPGETVTVTRTDESDVTVNLKIHSIRENASAPFRDDYDRPLILSSRTMTIASGQTLSLTSAFGGPIHALFNADGEEISLDFENVGEHPVWRGPEDTSAFLNGLDANEYDWAEFVTPRFEIHSTRSKMLETLDLVHTSTPNDLLEMTDIYMRDWPHWLAGFEGPGISENQDLRAFASANGLTISTASNVKHMNADRPACIASAPRCAGTSGNPYDALWFFDPIRLGDLHELGHGLEFRTRHHFEGGNTVHSTTNLYSYHTSYRYFKATGGSNFSCTTLPYEALYTAIQNSQLSADPGQYMRDENPSTPTEQNAIFLQLFTALESQGVFDDGWLMMPRMNLVTREFLRSNNDAAWAEKAAGLGFAGMDRATAFSLSQNDWLLITLSWASQRDLRAYLDMWGYIYSDETLDHVASLGLPQLRPAYYGISSRGHCFGLTHNELPIDGRTNFSTSSASAKVAAFTPDYFTFAEHEHTEMCALGDEIEDLN